MKLIGSINHYRADLSGWIGSVIMLMFAGVAGFRWHLTGLIFFALLLVRDLAAAWFLLSRNTCGTRTNSRRDDLIAYASSALPLFYLSESSGLPYGATISALLAIAGFTLSTLALFDLGSSFGVSPANRGLVRSGIYRHLRHPMYTGYVIAELGFMLLNPMNGVIFVGSVGLYVVRTKFEEQVLQECNKS